MAALIRHHLYAFPEGEQLRRCTPWSAPECSALLSVALYEALTSHVEPIYIAKLEQLDRVDSAAIRSIAFEHLEHGEVFERMSALVLLDRASRLEPGPLPAGAFADLASKPVAETQLLLRYSRYAGLPDAAVVAEVRQLAGSAGVDSRVQHVALDALSRAGTRTELSEVVRSLLSVRPPEWEGWDDSVAPALARCGIACADASVEMVAHAHEPSALAANIVRRSHPRDRSGLLDRLAPALSDDELREIHESVDL